MKKTIIFLLCAIMLVSCIPINAFATGDGNIDGGGGGMGDGTDKNYWTGGNDGVRVTIVSSKDNSVAATPVDFTNKKPDNIQMHFGKKSKLQYRNGDSLTPKTNVYEYVNPSLRLPRIISTDGNVNIEAIKSYFTDELAVRYIANVTGISFDDLISGKYKILLEPIAYFTFQGIFMGMTAHEAALYDQKLNGLLKAWMRSLTHKNLPLSMFLEKPDMGYGAWNGSTSNAVSDSQILSSLGLGIVSFKELDMEVSKFDYEYRCDTDVITAVRVYASGGRITPDSSAEVSFNANGQTSSTTVTIPAGGSQLVWIKWHTPAKPQNVNITASVSGNYSARIGGNSRTANISAKIVDLNEKVPPNPTANDTKPNGYSIPAIPSKAQRTSATWGVWNCYWLPDWEWESDDDGGGSWVDKGDWEYEWLSYYASLSASISVKPDEKVPTSSGKTMKSGYGINQKVKTVLNSNAPASHITGAQNVLSYFPEFNYKDYLRLSDRTTGGYNAEFDLKQNGFSSYNSRVHFTPLWFPDGQYTVYSEVIDLWTPDGMLSCNLCDYVNIQGSLFDDWHIAPK